MLETNSSQHRIGLNPEVLLECRNSIEALSPETHLFELFIYKPFINRKDIEISKDLRRWYAFLSTVSQAEQMEITDNLRILSKFMGDYFAPKIWNLKNVRQDQLAEIKELGSQEMHFFRHVFSPNSD